MATPQTRSAIATAAYYVAAGRGGSMTVSTADGVAAIRASRQTWLSDRVIAEMIARCAISCGKAVDFDLPEKDGADSAPDNAQAPDIVSMLPDLRLAARILTHEKDAADRLVAETLTGAIATVKARDGAMPVEQWLFGLLCSMHQRGRVRHLN